MRAHYDQQLLDNAALFGVERILEDQHRVILREQARAAGLTCAKIDRLVRNGTWRRVFPCVLTDADPNNVMTRICAAWLWAGPGAAVAARASLLWRGLLDQGASTDNAGPIDIYLPRQRSRVVPDGIRVHRGRLDVRDTQRRNGIVVTTTARACLDLARWGAARDYLELALRRRFTSPEKIQRALHRMTMLRGYPKSARAALDVATCPWSPPERTLHVGLREAGVTGWTGNAAVPTALGDLHPDIAFADIKLAVEIKGRRYHDEAIDKRAFDRDHGREQALVDAGWEVLNFTAKQIETDLAGVIATILRRVTALRKLAALSA